MVKTEDKSLLQNFELLQNSENLFMQVNAKAFSAIFQYVKPYCDHFFFSRGNCQIFRLLM